MKETIKKSYAAKATPSIITDASNPAPPIRCIEEHINYMDAGPVSAFYVRLEDGTLHGQFETHAAATYFAQTA